MALPTDIAPGCLRFWAHPGTIVDTGGVVQTWRNAAGTTNAEGISLDLVWPFDTAHAPEVRAGGPGGGPYVYFDQLGYVPVGFDTDPLRILESYLFYWYEFLGGATAAHELWGIIPNYASGPEADWFVVARLDRIDAHDDGSGLDLDGFEAAMLLGNFGGLALFFTRDDLGRYFVVGRSDDADGVTTLVQGEIALGQWVRAELRHEAGVLTLAVDCSDVESAPAADSVSGSGTDGAAAVMEADTNADAPLIQFSVSEVICYDCALSAAERAAMCAYLGAGAPARVGFVFAQTTG